MRRAFRTSAAAFAVAVLLTVPVAAQTDTTRVIRLDSLSVTVMRTPVAASRLPVALSVLGADEVREGRNGLGLEESLDRVPGLVVNNRYNYSLGTRISIRGLGARAAFGVRGVRIIADGIPLTMPDGQSNLTNLDLGGADRIEVIRGPASTLYGNAAGGVISVTGRAPPPAFSTESRVLAGDADHGTGLASTARVEARAGGPLGSGGWIAGVSRLETDGYRAFSRAEQTLVDVRAHQSLSNADRLSFVLNAVDEPVAQSAGALPRDSVLRDRRMAWPASVRTGSGEAARQVQMGLAWTHEGRGPRSEVSVYGLGRALDNALPYGYIELDRRSAGTRATFTLTPADSRVVLEAGVDAEWMRDGRRETDNVDGRPGTELRRDQTDRVRSLGPFAQATFALDGRTDLTGAVRYDAVRFETTDHLLADGRDDSGSRTLSAVSPMLGISRRLRPNLRIWANLATGFQTPTTTELINAPPAAGQPCCPTGFNTTLEPQRATSVEAGLRGSAGRFRFEAAAYRMDVRNAIVPFQVAGVDGRDFFRNAGRTRHRGIEATLATDLGPHRATLAYTFNDFTFIDDGDPGAAWEGNRLPGVPRQHVFAGLALRPRDGLRIDLEVEHTGSYFADDGNDAASLNDAATVADLRVACDLRTARFRLTPFLTANNLANARYNSSVVVNAVGGRYFEPAPGRNFDLGVSVGTGTWAR